MSLDENGYPPDEILEEIKNFSLLARSPDEKNLQRLPELIELIYDHWWNAWWGFKYHRDTGILELHTGGWSGNEEIIMALQESKSLFWGFFWCKSYRGGHYWFELYMFDVAGKRIIPDLSFS